jgi:hypothetical protein
LAGFALRPAPFLHASTGLRCRYTTIYDAYRKKVAIAFTST